MPKANAFLKGSGMNSQLSYAAAQALGPKFFDKRSISYQDTGGENFD